MLEIWLSKPNEPSIALIIRVMESAKFAEARLAKHV